MSLSTNRGFELTGGVGLHADYPAHVELGPVGSIDSVELSLENGHAHDHRRADRPPRPARRVDRRPRHARPTSAPGPATSASPTSTSASSPRRSSASRSTPARSPAADSSPTIPTAASTRARRTCSSSASVCATSASSPPTAPASRCWSDHRGLPAGAARPRLHARRRRRAAGDQPDRRGRGAAGRLEDRRRSTRCCRRRTRRRTPAQLVATPRGAVPAGAGAGTCSRRPRASCGARPTLITIELVLCASSCRRPCGSSRSAACAPCCPTSARRSCALQVDVLGVIDFDRSEAAVDATLVDSRLAQFALTGDMALRMSWGAQPSFLLAVGGFHPRFAAPPGFPALQRVAVALAAGDNPKLRLEAYLALTSNTVQFGARVDLAAKAGSFSIAGFLSFDALLTLEPLAFVVDIAAKLAVKVGGHTLLSVSLALTLSGPRPWRARGARVVLDPVLRRLLRLRRHDRRRHAGPRCRRRSTSRRCCSRRSPTRARGARSCPPAPTSSRCASSTRERRCSPTRSARSQVRQRVAPLERTLDRFGTSVPSGAKRFGITLATIGGVRTTLTPLQRSLRARAVHGAQRRRQALRALVRGDDLGRRARRRRLRDRRRPSTSASSTSRCSSPRPASPSPSPRSWRCPADVFGTLTATPPARRARLRPQDAA